MAKERSTPKGKSAKQIVKDLAQDVEDAASEVVMQVANTPKDCPENVRVAYAKYVDTVARLARATGAGA